jgi:malate permease and related proteins
LVGSALKSMETITNQILILGLTTLIGYLAYKLKAISSENNQSLVKIIIKITLPLLLFTTISSIETNTRTLINGIAIFVFAMLTVLILFITSSFSGKLLKLDKENRALHKVHSMFGNVVFLGFPLLDALIPGGKGLLYATIFQLGQDSLMWTLGIVILSKAKSQKSKHSWKHLLNLNTMAFAAGFLVYFSGINIPEIPYKAMSGIGHTTIYLSMIYVGVVLAQVKFITLIKNLRSWVLSFNKLLLGPSIIFIIILFLNTFNLNWLEKDAITVIILQAGMPCMIIVSILAREMGLNDTQATQNIFVSTILSIFSLPFLYFLLQTINS